MRGLTGYVVAAALAVAAPFARAALAPPSAPADLSGFPGFPAEFEGRPLVRLPETDLDRRFLADLVGTVARFSDGEREIIFRWALHAHRDVHPSAVCFRAAGWDIAPAPVRTDSSGGAWGAFVATRGGEERLVREQVRDAAGRTWSDVTSWYWASLSGSVEGAAWTTTVVERRR